MYKVLTIAGSDSSGGAGIQADLKTFLANNTYGMSVITAITAQNTMKITTVEEIGEDVVKAQIDAVFTDIVPDAVKIGMVSSASIIEAIAERLRFYQAKNIVLDTVMVSTSGHALLKEEATMALIHRLLPMADIITPNILEATVLSGIKISSKEDMLEAARRIREKTEAAILIKGGHLKDCADDLLLNQGGMEPIWFPGERVVTGNTHGTGCTLSSAIAANLSKGLSMEAAVQDAKEYITAALSSGLNLGHGSGPVDHGVRGRNYVSKG